MRYPILAPALILVGALMLNNSQQIPWGNPTEYLPAFLTVVTIPFASSISAGIAIGFVSYAAIRLHWALARMSLACRLVRSAIRSTVLPDALKRLFRFQFDDDSSD